MLLTSVAIRHVVFSHSYYWRRRQPQRQWLQDRLGLKISACPWQLQGVWQMQADW